MERQYQVLFRSGVSKILPPSYVEGIDKAYEAYKQGGPNKRLKFSDGSLAFVCDLESIVRIEDHQAMREESERVQAMLREYRQAKASVNSAEYQAWKETWKRVANSQDKRATVEQVEAARIEWNERMKKHVTFDEYVALLPASIRRDIELQRQEQ